MHDKKTAPTSQRLFEVSGAFAQNEKRHSFKKTVAAQSEKRAREKALADIGSHHRVSRHKIEITAVTESKA